MPTLNFSNVPKRVPLPEGEYVLVVKDVTAKTSQSGNDMYVVQFQDPESKTVIFDNFSLLPQALFHLQALLKALGYDVDADMEFDPKEILGYMVRASVVQEEYEGTIKNRITKFFAQ